jgi:hypothetical protein
VITITFERQPPLVLPNLATFTSVGAVVLAIPAQLGQDPIRSAGHGAWRGTGEGTAEIRFAMLVTDPQGALVRVETVRASMRLDGGDAAGGTFVLDSTDRDGRATAGIARGTVRASRISADATAPVVMPGASATTR